MEVMRGMRGSETGRRSACERCHKCREKCVFNVTKAECHRCLRLGLSCQPRSWKRMGRKPRSLQMSGQETYSLHVFSLSPAPKVPHEIRESFLSEEGFFHAPSHFIIGKTFAEGFRRVVLQLFAYSPEVLGDGCRALIALMRTHQYFPSSESYISQHVKVGTRCLRSLISLSNTAKSIQDATVLIFLGQILVAFNALLPLGSSTRIITRGSLLSVRLWYPSMQNLPHLDDITVAPVLIDTVDCLIRREVPVVRWIESERAVIDRLMGVCSSLLPMMYDLCIISHSSRTSPLPPGSNDPYVNVEGIISRWQPQHFFGFSEKYTKIEIGVMNAQACSYRLALLLIIHRLRNPLGIEDAVGCRFAKGIMKELSLLLQFHSEIAATGFGIDFPLLIAAIELPERGVELLNMFERYRYGRRHGVEMVHFVERVHRARVSGYNGLWFDLVEECMTGDILP